MKQLQSRSARAHKLFELRAATRLAGLWRDQGKRDEARNLLAPVYGTEGFGTRDLKEPKALLDEPVTWECRYLLRGTDW